MSEFEVGLTPVDPAAFIVQGLEEGLSGNAILRGLQEAGAGMNRGTFFQMVGEIRGAIGAREELQGLDYGAIPEGSSYSTWRAGAGDQYATFVTSYVRPVGSLDIEQRYYTHITNDPHSPQDAIDAAQDFLDRGNEQGSGPSADTTMGSVITSINRTVARR